MRKITTVSGLALLAAACLSCADYFDGTNLYFDFSKLESLVKLAPTDKDCTKIEDEATCTLPAPPPEGHAGCIWLPNDPEDQSKGYSCQGKQLTLGLCADELYVSGDPAHPVKHPPHPGLAGAFEYQAWATINGSPVRLARFTVRECTIASNDKDIKPLITSVSYRTDPKYGYPDRASHSEYFGAVDAVIDAIPVGAGYMSTPVRMNGATEVFVTKEPLNAPDSAPPTTSAILTKGTLTADGDVLTGALEKLTLTGPSGHVTAIIVNRTSAW